ncbi:HHL284Cp [Eremothecium sinecaudum]|uniref:Transcription initiation factor IIE subunit beta n=1 Tax=Eremothecium sinecaudum TaxID=45286 RepID=A0A120K2T0_9SACH|nr:HHL284Cp [Eremothecium sinecaudum]AMD22486.1 HHL284Cp [Eremothecium sinecaudum]
MSNDLLANLNAFKSKIKTAPVITTRKVVTNQDSGSVSSPYGSTKAAKREASKDNDDRLDQAQVSAAKKLKLGTASPQRSATPSATENGKLDSTHLSTKMLIATEYIQERAEAVPIDQIESYLSLPKDNNVIPMLKGLAKFKFDPKKNTLQYVSIYDVHSAEELLKLTRTQVTFKGISCKELKDGWPQCYDVIDELEKKHRILVSRTKKDNSPRFVWYNTGGPLHEIEEDFVKMWENCKLPQRPELPRKLQDLGLKPASVDPATIKRQGSTRVEVKKRKQRKGKITNTHMAGILKDYSDRV